MTLSKKALKAINVKGTRLKLAISLDVTEQSIIRMIKDKSDNLTKAAAVRIIKEETGLTEDEIFANQPVSA